LNAVRYWLALTAVLGAVAFAGQPPPPAPPAPDPNGAGAQGTPPQGALPPNDDFIEYLGEDDVGDTELWEFLKNSPPRKGQPPDSPPQEASND
jgi:hypothetical protein